MTAKPEEIIQSLQFRHREIEQAIFARAYSVSDPSDNSDLEYVAGFRPAIASAVRYGIECISRDEDSYAPPPPSLLIQARRAANSGVALDTVLRRYFAGYTILGDFVMQEAQRLSRPAHGSELQRLSRSLASLFEHVVQTATEEYRRAAVESCPSIASRRARRVEKLVAGELVDSRELEYDIDARWHLGVVATGSEVPRVLRGLTATLSRRLLLVSPDQKVTWGWLGGDKRFTAEEVRTLASVKGSGGMIMALGEPAYGFPGWHLTHRQARTALSVGLQGGSSGLIRYVDVALIASALRDDTLSASLAEIYLAPIEPWSNDGATLCRTLAAYLAAGQTVAAAAAALRVNRKTISVRLRSIEKKIGRQIGECTAELELALDLWNLRELGTPH